MLLDGEASLVNSFDKHQLNLGGDKGKIPRFANFGFGRYLSCQGMSFYGDIVASGPKDSSVMCLFIPGSLFHKIPFEDWYRMREELYKR